MNTAATPGFVIENVRESGNRELIDKAMARWIGDGVMSGEEARKRARQLLMVATTEADGTVAGMATTYLQTQPALRLPLWHMRAYVAPAFRKQEIAIQMLFATVDFHKSQYESGADRSGCGLYMEIENPHIKKNRNEAIWPTTRLAFVGLNAKGDHCRVRYFEGARLD